MSLHRRKHYWRTMRRPGLPEVVALGLVATLMVLLTLWLRNVNQPDWQETRGIAITGQIETSVDTARPVERKVHLTYQYQVDGQMYTGRYDDFWPAGGSPNALIPADLTVLTQRGHPLTVHYDPAHPSNSQLHFAAGASSLIYLTMSGIMCVVAVLYCLVVYPAWRAY